MTNPKYITIVRDAFENESEFWASVHGLTKELVNLNYTVNIRWDCADPGVGVLVVEFDQADEECADLIHTWVTLEELEMLTNRLSMQEEETASTNIEFDF